MAEPDVKPDVKPNTASSDVLNLVIRDAQGDEVHFKVKPTTKFEKIFNAWKTRKAVQTGVRFMVDGVQLHEHRTPADENLEDGDAIDAMAEQIGGSAC